MRKTTVFAGIIALIIAVFGALTTDVADAAEPTPVTVKVKSVETVEGLISMGVQGDDFLRITVVTTLSEPIFVKTITNSAAWPKGFVRVKKIVSVIRTDKGLVSSTGTGPVFRNGIRVQTPGPDWTYVEQSDAPQAVWDAVQDIYTETLAGMPDAPGNPVPVLTF